jgi:hypothetical protein
MRRRNSRATTSIAAPTQLAANIALFLMCHDPERKQESTMRQFQSIYIRQSKVDGNRKGSVYLHLAFASTYDRSGRTVAVGHDERCVVV